MKQQTKYNLIALSKGLAVLGSAIAGKVMVAQHNKIGMLEQELSNAQQKVETTKLDRNNYRKQLIYNGNPEGWQTNFADMTGEIYFTRDNSDALGNYWTEYLH